MLSCCCSNLLTWQAGDSLSCPLDFIKPLHNSRPNHMSVTKCQLMQSIQIVELEVALQSSLAFWHSHAQYSFRWWNPLDTLCVQSMHAMLFEGGALRGLWNMSNQLLNRTQRVSRNAVVRWNSPL